MPPYGPWPRRLRPAAHLQWVRALWRQSRPGSSAAADSAPGDGAGTDAAGQASETLLASGITPDPGDGEDTGEPAAKAKGGERAPKAKGRAPAAKAKGRGAGTEGERLRDGRQGWGRPAPKAKVGGAGREGEGWRRPRRRRVGSGHRRRTTQRRPPRLGAGPEGQGCRPRRRRLRRPAAKAKVGAPAAKAKDSGRAAKDDWAGHQGWRTPAAKDRAGQPAKNSRFPASPLSAAALATLPPDAPCGCWLRICPADDAASDSGDGLAAARSATAAAPARSYPRRCC